MLNVGRSTLREGIKKLEAEDSIEIINGKGIYVKQISPFRIYTSFSIQDEKKYLLEALEVRTVLEAKAVQLAVANVTEEQIKKNGISSF